MNQLLDTAKIAAHEAGDAIMKLYADTDFETKTDGSPVTVADGVANDILLTHLTETGIPILSEESIGIATPYPERLWILDPLDGTKDFIHKTGDFCVMIGLLEHGKPILGVVYAPAHDTLYYATKGNGAYKEHAGVTEKLVVADTHTGALRFVRSVNHFTEGMQTVSEKLEAEHVPRGSIGVKAGVVAENMGDFFFYPNAPLGEWDVCAPQCILEEAGGIVTDTYGNPLVYGNKNHRIEHGALFSTKACHEHVLTTILENIDEQHNH